MQSSESKRERGIGSLFIKKVACFLFLPLLLLSCASVEKSDLREEGVPSREGFVLVPESDETVYAQRIASEIEKEVVVVKAEFVNDYLDEIGQRIIGQTQSESRLGDLTWSFKVIDSSDVNAFAVLGGTVYIYRGLIEATESESELAGVVAFEIGHIMARNPHHCLSEKLMRHTDLAPGELITGEKGWERLYRVFKMSGGCLAFFSGLKYSPSQVKEADDFAFSKTYDGGFNPQGLVTLVNRLGKKGEPSYSWMVKNPWSHERQERLLSRLKLLPSFPFPERRPRFNSFKVRLRSLLYPSLKKETDEHLVPEQEIVHRVTVLGNVGWTDTSFDVKEGQEIYFKASGGISLQKGNPMAFCGPDGYDYKTVQQPILDKKIGALIGKVVYLVSVEVDEETGEEIRNEIVEIFYVGSENSVRMPLSGCLLLGINEDVVGDNSGEYRVEIHLKKI